VSRILKAKLRRKNDYDKEYGEFLYLLNNYLEREKNAYVSRNKWVDELFLKSKYVENSHIESWLHAELCGLFLSIYQKADQVKDGKQSLYVFFGKEEIKNDDGELRGMRPVYKMILQDSGADVVLNGEIKG